jgi:pimeloyl-ACP methyl ester carboxylesterase
MSAGAERYPRPQLPPYETVEARAEVAYWDLGSGDPILLLHTFPDHSLGMLPVAERFAAEGFRVILPTLPGYWPSGKVEGGDYSIPAVAADLVALLDSLGLERVDLVGHGWGGEITYFLAAELPQRVGRAAVLSVPHQAGLAARHLTFEGLQSAGYAYFLAYSAKAPEAASQPEWLNAVIAWGSPGMYREDWPQILGLIARREEIEVAGRYYRCDLEDSRPMRPVPVPTLVVHGAETPALPPSLYEGLEEWFPGGLRRHLVEGAGQWPHREAPDEVLPLILEHLRDG